MINVSDETKKAYQNDGYIKHYKVIFPELKDSEDKELTFTDPQIVAESLSIKEAIQSGDSLDFTGCISTTAEIEIANTNYDFKDKVMKITVQIDGTDEIPLFYGKVDKVEKEGAFSLTKKIRAYDFMYKFDEKDATEWYQALSYPMTYKQFRDSFWKKFGLVENADDNQQETTLMNDDIVIEKKQLSDDSTLTAASVIQAICQVNACFGVFNREGKFKYITFEAIQEALYPSPDLYPDSELFPSAENTSAMVTPIGRIINIKYENNKTKEIVGVGIIDDSAEMVSSDGSKGDERSFIGKAGSVGKDDNCYIIETNFLTYGMGGNSANTMCERMYALLKQIQYIPCDVKIKGLPYTEVGDIIVMEGAGDIIRTYVLSRNLTGTSDLQDDISAKGEAINSPIVSIDELINSEIFRRKIGNEHLYSLVEQTSSSILLEVRNVDENLRTAIELTDGAIIAEVERAQNSETAITTRVELTETELTLHAGEISTLSQNLSVVSQNVNLKADKVTVDAAIVNIEGTLSAHSASIGSLQTETANIKTLAAGKIDAGYLSANGYVTASQMASGIGTSIWTTGNMVASGTISAGGNISSGGVVSGAQGSFSTLYTKDASGNSHSAQWKSATVMTSPQTSTTIHYLGY